MNEHFRLLAVLGFLSALLLVPRPLAVAADVKTEAENPAPAEGDDIEAEIDRLHQEIGLSAEQEAVLKKYRQEHRDQIHDLHGEIRDARNQIKEELQKTQFDPERVKALHEKIKSLKVQLEDKRLEGIMEVRGVLSPEQFARFMEIKEKYKDKWYEYYKGQKKGDSL